MGHVTVYREFENDKIINQFVEIIKSCDQSGDRVTMNIQNLAITFLAAQLYVFLFAFMYVPKDHFVREI